VFYQVFRVALFSQVREFERVECRYADFEPIDAPEQPADHSKEHNGGQLDEFNRDLHVS
jgi:hypothetical protein